jgi:uncharacterized protein (DUF488 family)
LSNENNGYGKTDLNNKTMKARELITIGYEGREIEQFIDCLKQQRISRLIDIREVPISRKRGFSKSALKERLEDENIGYIHLRALGSPSFLRKKLKFDQNYQDFFKAYSKYLTENFAVVDKLYQYISDGINCLMCYELSEQHCHRSIVAQAIKEYGGNGLKITHI